MRLQGKSKKTKAAIFVALSLISCSLVFLQLGITNFGGGSGSDYYTFSLIPVAVTAFLLGAPWGLLQGALTGFALCAHATLQPLDWVDYALLIHPLCTAVPLALVGFGLGCVFSRFLRPEHKRCHNVLVIAACSVAGPVLFDMVFYFAILLSVYGVSEITFSLFAEQPYATALPTLLLESIALFVSLMLVDSSLRHVVTTGVGARLRVVFGSRLFGLLLVVFAVVAATGYTLITHFDVLETSEEMGDQLDAIADGLEQYWGKQEYDDAAAIIFQTITDKNDGSLVLLDNTGTVVASNDAAYAEGAALANGDGVSVIDHIKCLASDATMDLMYDWDLGKASGEDTTEQSLTASFLPKGFNRLNYVRAKQVGAYYLLQIRSHETVFRDRGAAMLVSVFIAGIALVLAFVFASKLLRVMVEQPIDNANKTLAKITDGDLNQEVQLLSSRELASLAAYINAAVTSLKEYAAESQRRIEQDLRMARDIQKSALPRTFPPFPGIDAFDVYASMDAAKYVGGDFYDLFLVGNHKLGFLIADVSGKGISAALFMMRAKTRISTAMQSGVDLVQAVTQTNAHLCEDNDTAMFVTMWAAILDWDTGELTYVNAGHDIPLLRHDGQWQWFEDVGGPFLGAMDFVTYDCATVTLAHGDALYLYTDGVTEAMNPKDQLYGKDRMLAFLQQHADMRPRELNDAMREEVGAWADGAEQSDDITMLALEYK